MSGPVAMENAQHDLRTHEVGMMAGTQAAVQGLFERFDPQLIESQLESQGRHKPLYVSAPRATLGDVLHTVPVAKGRNEKSDAGVLG